LTTESVIVAGLVTSRAGSSSRGRLACARPWRAAFAFPALGLILVWLLLIAMPSSWAVAAPSIGLVTKVDGQAQIGGTAAAVGSMVHMNDALTTSAKSHLEVTFRDKTTLSLGENARVVIDKYVFNPEASTGELLLNSSAAAFRLTTGRLNEMQNRQIQVSTPGAALAVRGTDFWSGRIKDRQGVLLINDSKVEVAGNEQGASGCARHTDEPSCNADTPGLCHWSTKENICRGCTVTLDKANEGTYVNRGECPGPPSKWPPELVAQALAQTTVGATAAAGSAGAAAAAAAGAAGAAAGFAGSTSSTPSEP
jgi:hypothetical protein